MKKIVEYTIFSNHQVAKLIDCVNSNIKRGWVLHGSPFSDGEYNRADRSDCCLHQAMVRYSDDEK